MQMNSIKWRCKWLPLWKKEASFPIARFCISILQMYFVLGISFQLTVIHREWCCCSVTKSCPTLQPHELQHAWLPCPSLSPGVCSNACPLKSVMSFYHLILCCPLLLLPSILPIIRIFSNESALCIRWPKYWSFIQLQHQSFQWTFRVDFL